LDLNDGFEGEEIGGGKSIFKGEENVEK